MKATSILETHRGHRWTAEETARVEENLGLVGAILNHTAQAMHLDRDEREQIGRFGLVKAALGWDGVTARFSTYACHVVYRELQRAHCEDRTIRVPKNAFDGRSGDVGAASRALGTASLDALGCEPEGRTDEPDDGPYDELYAAIDRLPSRERYIVRRRLAGDTLRAIGADIGLTKERVRQIHCEAVRNLRAMLAGVAR
jgi:RNA polymerase sigma factor (sigma-70 family)